MWHGLILASVVSRQIGRRQLASSLRESADPAARRLIPDVARGRARRSGRGHGNRLEIGIGIGR